MSFPSQSAPPTETAPVEQPSLLQRRVVKPLMDLLRIGCTPRKLAWSIAIGFIIGINPLLGSTTIVSLAVAGIFRLNLVASQLATHLSYPLEIALFFVFIRLGDKLFHTGRMPLHHEALISAVRHHPIETTKLLWTWEWHALVIWALASIVITPVIVFLLMPVLNGLSDRMHRQAAGS